MRRIGEVKGMDSLGIAVLIVFVGTYLVISTEKVNRTGMALLGMGLIGVVFWVAWSMMMIPSEVAHDPSLLAEWEKNPFIVLVGHVEWDTILFVTSMMLLVAVAGASGMFQYIALRLVKPSEGDHKRLFITFLVFVFAVSLFFDTTSTMLITAPLTIEVCKALEIDFKPYLIAEAITCNFASIPSIVGAVPNLVIANETNIDPGFLFIVFMPLAIILFLISLPIFLRYYARYFGISDSYRVEALFSVDPTVMIRSRRDFYISVVAMGVLIVGFSLGPTFGIAPAMVALIVAACMLLVAHDRAAEMMGNVGWDTVFFLVGLFGLVAALSLTGLIDELGDGIESVIGENAAIATVFMIWIPAMLSAFLDNLPVSAVLAPIALRFASLSPVLPLALVFAVNIGGYIFTPLGSPANMIVIGHSEKEHDPIPFIDFIKIGTLLGMIHLAIGSGWLILISALMGV
jgi:Na+/H+ antiporter NhaD/arsenite permease-like protein